MLKNIQTKEFVRTIARDFWTRRDELFERRLVWAGGRAPCGAVERQIEFVALPDTSFYCPPTPRHRGKQRSFKGRNYLFVASHHTS